MADKNNYKKLVEVECDSERVKGMIGGEKISGISLSHNVLSMYLFCLMVNPELGSIYL